jgi:hypothetical protein
VIGNYDLSAEGVADGIVFESLIDGGSTRTAFFREGGFDGGNEAGHREAGHHAFGSDERMAHIIENLGFDRSFVEVEIHYGRMAGFLAVDHYVGKDFCLMKNRSSSLGGEAEEEGA